MTKINIDNKEYELEALSDHAKSQVHMIQLAEAEINRLNAQLAMIQTARKAYLNALAQELNPVPNLL